MNRRSFAKLLGVALVSGGCAAPPASPTAAPTKPAAPQAASPAAAPPTTAPSQPKPTAAPAAKATAAPATASKAPRASLKYGVPTAFDGQIGLVAQARGFYAEQNLDVDVQLVASGSTLTQGLLAGEFDVVENDVQPILTAVEKGGDAKIISSFCPGHVMALVAKKEINGLADLAGKPLASGTPGSFPYNTLQLLFEQAGIDMQRSQLMPLSGTPARVQALFAGEVDATVIALDEVPAVLRNANMKVLLNAKEKLPNFLAIATQANGKLLRERREVAVRLSVALTKAVRSVFDDPEGTARVWAPLVKREPPAALEIVQTYLKAGVLDPDGKFTTAAVEYVQDLNLKLNQQSQKVQMSQVADTTIQDEVIRLIGPYKKS